MRAVVHLRIERFHARYHGVTPGRSVALDRALAELVDGGLEAALAEALGPEPDRAWAICISEVTVEVALGEAGVAACVADWAEEVAAAVRAAVVASGSVSTASSPVVVFASRGSALVDLVRRVALDDQRHAWAWRQAGLIHARGGEPAVAGADVVAALRREPLLVPGVLREVGPELFGRVVAPDDLVRLAALVAAAAGATAPADAPESQAAPPPAPAAGPAAVDMAAASLPSTIRGRAHDTIDAHRLGVLAALTADPRRVTDPAFLCALASAFARGPAPAPDSPEPTPTPSRLLSPDAADAAADTADAPDGERTSWGGVWFLAHGLAVTGVAPTVRSAAALARLVAVFTTAPPDDAAVRGLCGLDPDEPPEPPVTDKSPNPVALEALGTWLAGLADGRLAGRDPDALWRRDATIRRRPGEIEVELALTDVDAEVRAAGLDLDPGWVGWLGVFVRFRYA